MVATRVYAGAESLAATSANTTATPADALTLTFTPDASSTYALFFSAEHCQTTNNTTQANARFYHSTASTILHLSSREPYTQTADVEWFPISGVVPVTFGSSPGSQDFKLQYYNETGTASTQMRNARIFAIKLTSNDLSAVDLSKTDSTSTTYSDKLTWTAPATGTFDLFFTGVLQSTLAASQPEQVRVFIDSGSVVRWDTGATIQFCEDTDDRTSMACHTQVTCTSGDVIRWQFRRPSGAGTVSMLYAAIVGFRTTDMDANYIAEDQTARTTTSTTKVERNAASTLTYTAAGGCDHFMFGAVNLNRTTNTTRSMAESDFPDGTNYFAPQFRGAAGGYGHMLSFRYRQDVPAGSVTQKWYIKSVEAGTTNSDFATMGAWRIEQSMDRVYASAEALTQTTMTSSTYADKLSLVIPSADLASSTWFILANGQQYETTNNTTNTAMRLRNDTDATTLREQIQEPSAATNPMPFGLGAVVTFGAAPGAKTFKLQQASPSNVSTVASDRLRIFAIKLRGNDTAVTAAGPINPSSSTGVLTTLITWTCPADGTYDVIFGATETFNATTGNINQYVVVDTDGTTILRQLGDTASAQNKDGADQINQTFAVTKTMTTGQTLVLKSAKQGGTNTNQIYTNMFAVGFDAAEWLDRLVVNDDTDQTFATTGSSNEWTERPNTHLAYSVGDVSDYWSFVNLNFSYDSGSAVTGRMQPTIAGLPVAYFGSLAGNVPSTMYYLGFVGGLVLTARGTPFAVEHFVGTGSGLGFPADSWGGMSAVYKLKVGTGAPVNTPRAKTNAGRNPRQRQYRQATGISP